MKKRQVLGKGLESLIPIVIDNEEDESINNENNGTVYIKITEIEPNLDQPRKHFDDEKINALAESIKVHGVIQPLIVTKFNDIYRIVVGERRWRAAMIAGLEMIPCIIREVQGSESLEIALIENIQREDLNSIEEAEAYSKLITDFSFTQEQLSEKLGKSRPYISNILRLLSLTDKEKSLLILGDLTVGHARALLSINNLEKREECIDIIINNDLSVRETEKLVKKINESSVIEKNDVKIKKTDINIEYIEDRLKEKLSTMVKIINGKKKGKIIIEYYSAEELSRIIDIFEKE